MPTAIPGSLIEYHGENMFVVASYFRRWDRPDSEDMNHVINEFIAIKLGSSKAEKHIRIVSKDLI